jgi:hypothetical protein
MAVLTLKLLFFEGDVVLCQRILEEMVSKALDLDVGDVFGIPQEAVSDVLLLDVEVDLGNRGATSMRMRVSLNCLASSSFSRKLSPSVIT